MTRERIRELKDLAENHGAELFVLELEGRAELLDILDMALRAVRPETLEKYAKYCRQCEDASVSEDDAQEAWENYTCAVEVDLAAMLQRAPAAAEPAPAAAGANGPAEA